MAEERIDIKVTDSGSDKAAKGLRAIASEATAAQRALDQVSASLSRLPTTQLNAMAGAAAKAADASARVAAAEKRAASAIDRTRAATASANTESARAATVINSRARSAEDAARAEARFAASQREWASESAGWQRRLSSQNASFAQVQRSVASSEAVLASARDKSTAATRRNTAATQASTAAQNANAASVRRAGDATRLAGHHQANLVAQINDIGVSLASGQNPFLVLIQQGSQLQDLSMRVDGGFKTLARSVLNMIKPFTLAAAVFGVMAVQFSDFRKQINDDAGLKEYVKTLGLTKKELKELEKVHVTFGDVALGVWDTFNDALNLTEAFNKLKSGFSATVDFIWSVFKNFTFALIGSITGTYNAVITIWNGLPAAFSDLFTRAVNLSIGALEWLANKSVDVLNRLGGDFERVTLGRMENANAGAAARMGRDIGNGYIEGFKTARDNYDTTIAYINGRAQNRARNRLSGQAAKIIDDRTDKKNKKTGPTEEEKRAEALRRVNEQLDNEISRMGMLRREREVQQRFDQIEEQLLNKKIKLTGDERKAIRDKIVLLQREGEIQSAMDGIYEDINGATLKYNATLEAATRLLDAGRISYEQYTQAVNKAKLAHDSALDPLLDMGMAQDAAMRATRLYGVEAQKAAYYEQVRNQLMREGIILSAQYVQGENAKVDALMRGNAELLRQQQANSVIGSIVDPLKEKEEMLSNEQFYYDELKRLREENYINEEQYALASASLARKYDELKLQNASDFFSALAGLSSSSNRELAAIGKAAAITQATINTFLAVSEAMRVPWPANLPLMAQAAAQGAALVGQISSISVGNFATGGQVMVGGRDGVDKNNINMNVTKGERVTIETPAQQKATDAAIANGQGGGGANVNVSNINVVDPRFVIDSMDTVAGSRVITNIITANKREINAILGSR